MENHADSAIKSWTDNDMDNNVSCNKFRCSSCREEFCESPDLEKHVECHTRLKMLDTNTILSENEIVGQDVTEGDPKDLCSPSSVTCPTQVMLDDHMGSHTRQMNQDSNIVMNGNKTVDKDVIDTSPGHPFSPCSDTYPAQSDPDHHVECHQQLAHDSGTTTTNGNITTGKDVVETNPEQPCSPYSETCPTHPDLGELIASHTQQLNVTDTTTMNGDITSIIDVVGSISKQPCSPYSETCHTQPDLGEDKQSHTQQLNDSGTATTNEDKTTSNNVDESDPKLSRSPSSESYPVQSDLGELIQSSTQELNNKDADTTTNGNIGKDVIGIGPRRPSSQCVETGPIQSDLEDKNRETTEASESSTKYRCSSCAQIFFSQVDLDKHVDGHNQKATSHIRICKVVLTNLWITHPLIMAQLKDTDSKKEIVKMEVDENCPNYCCSSCFLTFSRRVDLEQHLESSWHSHQLNHMQSAYVNMDRIHIYRCDFCSRGSTDQTVMEEHRRTYFRINNRTRDNNNEGDKPFKCKLCDRGFMVASTLQAHSILHEPFPHVCECGVGFYQKHDLDAHRLLLTHNKPQVKKEASKTKTNFIRTEPKYKTSESESDEPRTSRKIGPRLKASLAFKRSKHRSNKSPNKRRPKLKIPKKECTTCDKQFIKVGPYKNHMRRIHGLNYETDIPCKVCGKMFESATHHRDHEDSHFGIKNYKCDICQKSYSQSGALKLHRLRHTGERNFPCGVCGKSFYDAATLRLHDRVHSGVKPFECKHCLKRFADPSAYKRHLMIHTGLKLHKCNICDKAFCDPSALYRHNRMHEGYTVACPHCGRTYASKASLRVHIKFAHGNFTSKDFFECDHCCKKFKSKGNLALHMRVHSNRWDSEKQCKCEICGKILLKNNLKAHIKRTHLKQYDYECGRCELRFVNKTELRNHKERTHRPRYVRDRSFECDYCHKWYFDKNSVEKHIVKKHLGIKCEICSRAFSTSVLLKIHRITGCIRCKVCDATFLYQNKLNYHFSMKHLKESEKEIYECDYCGKRFPLRSLIQKHIKASHLNPQSFECDDCGEAFSSRAGIVYHVRQNHMLVLYCHICFKRFYTDGDLLRHKRAECNPRPTVPCEICNKTFLNATRLSQHLRDTHIPGKYECDMCGKKFKRKSGLLRHFRLMHTF